LGIDYAQDIYYMLRTRAKNEAHERKLKKEEIEKLNEELDILGKAAIE